MRAAKKRGRGRPPKPPEQRKRHNLTMRLRDRTRGALVGAAAQNKRSLSEEAEARLEQSFDAENALWQAQDLAYGRFLSALLVALARAMRDTGEHAGFFADRSPTGAADWQLSPFAFDQVVRSINMVLEGFRPAGDPAMPTARKAGGSGDMDLFEKMGEMFARGILEAIKNPDRGGEIGLWAQPIRERLGEAAARIRTDAEQVMLSAIRPRATGPGAIVTLNKERGDRDEGGSS